jgi:nuclease S1
MKKFILSTILSLIGLVGFGWGLTGHRAIGKVAEQNLTKKTKKEITRILGQQTLAMASTWMDDVRSDSSFRFMDDWHWVTIKDGQNYAQSEKNPKGDIIQTLQRIIAELKSHKLSAPEEAQHVKILIHLIGDIHQPFHVGGRDDRGGNNAKVTWFKNESNMHWVWDSEMIDDTKLSYTELAESLEKPNIGQLQMLQKSSVLDWANESMSYRSQIYNIGNGKLGYVYTYNNFHTVRKRLMQAGVRLAGVLNEIYG